MAEATKPTLPALPTEAAIVTKDFLEGIIRRAENNEDLSIIDFSVEPACAEGSNFATVVLRIYAKVQSPDNKKDYKLILKTPHDHPMMKAVMIKGGVFKKELIFYRDILPALTTLQSGFNLGLAPLAAPKFYYGLSDEDTMSAMIVLEDVEGYKMADVGVGLDAQHCKLVVAELAKMHALSLVLKNRDVENIRKRFEFVFQETHFSSTTRPISSPMLSKSLVNAMELISEESTDEEFKSKVKSLLSVDAFDTILSCIEPCEPFAVICHGDAWANNMMFKYKDDDPNSPIAVKMVDFQMVRYALPTSDLSYFLFVSTTRSMRKTHLDDILKHYYTAFTNILENCKFSFPEYTYEVFLNLFKKTAMYGIISACMGLPPIIAKMSLEKSKKDMKEKSSIDDVTEEIGNMYDGVMSNPTIKEAVRERLSGNIQEITGNVIPVMIAIILITLLKRKIRG